MLYLYHTPCVCEVDFCHTFSPFGAGEAISFSLITYSLCMPWMLPIFLFAAFLKMQTC